MWTMVRVLDLYCGMGGLSLGIALALEDSIVHGIDIDPKAVMTYNLNLNKFGCCAEVADLLSWEPSRDYDVVVGGPPCQPFSIANTIRVGEAHPLFPTFRRYFELVRAIRPSAFVLENVKGLLTRRFKPLLEEQLGSLAADYRIRHAVLNAAHYGVPQRRERLIAVGVRTFNSLSRDHVVQKAWYMTLRAAFFQFPLSGSLPELLCVSSKKTSFQLPLSGSPSPIPGFSGSLRLSAAAALRTNEF